MEFLVWAVEVNYHWRQPGEALNQRIFAVLNGQENPLKQKSSLVEIFFPQSNQAAGFKGSSLTWTVCRSGWMEYGGLTPATTAVIWQIHFSDNALCAVDRSSKCHPPTPRTNQRQGPGSLFRTISQWAGCPLSLLTAHLVPVRWWCHVHSGFMSLRGADTETRKTGPASELAAYLTCIVRVVFTCIYLWNRC